MTADGKDRLVKELVARAGLSLDFAPLRRTLARRLRRSTSSTSRTSLARWLFRSGAAGDDRLGRARWSFNSVAGTARIAGLGQEQA